MFNTQTGGSSCQRAGYPADLSKCSKSLYFALDILTFYCRLDFKFSSLLMCLNCFHFIPHVSQLVQDGNPQASPPLGAGAPARDLFGQRLLPASEHGLQLPGPELLSS